MAEGVDYAYTKLDEAKLYAAGKRFAGRYIGLGGVGKLLTAEERDRLFAAGLDIMLLVEGEADSALAGYDKGVEFARRAQAHAKNLGAPADCVFYAAVDFDATVAQWPKVAEHLRGVASVIGLARTGVYGGIRTMQWAARDKVASHFFQTYAWSHGEWYPGNDVEQYRNGVSVAGGVVDLCRSKKDDFGQWRSEDKMPTAEEVANAVWAKKLTGGGVEASAQGLQIDTYKAATDLDRVDLPAINVKLDQILTLLAGGIPGGPTLDEIRGVVDEELDEAFSGGADKDTP